MSYWQDKPGSSRSENWFKEHPKATLCLLLIAVVVIVVMSV